MSVVLEFTVERDDFTLGRALSGPPDMRFEVERIVPTGDQTMPFVWATGASHERFEETVREDPAVGAVHLLDSVGDRRLYRVDWEETDSLVQAIVEASATVLEAHGNARWTLRLRFPGQEELSRFHDACLDASVPLQVVRTTTSAEDARREHRVDLSPEQREALVLALRHGYFDTPRETTLEELAVELDISRQALSERIRRGNERLLRQSLPTPGPERD